MRSSILTSAIFCLIVSYIHAQTETFNYTGQVQTYTVPSCVTSIDVVVAGAQGGGLNGGNGSTVTATIDVIPGQILEIYVGGQGECPAAGFNGGGFGATASGLGNEGCGGGGASDIRFAPYALANRVIVAAGGGGMGGGDTDALGGTGGCDVGGIGTSPFGQGGGGATQLSGGTGGPPWIASGTPGQAGSLGIGGNGATDPCFDLGPGGGGGGGFYGGGSGGSDCFGSFPLGGGGGGGGSSLTPTGGNCISGNNGGQGFVSITPSQGGMNLVIEPSAPVFCEGESVSITISGGVNYVWSPSESLNSATGPTVVANPTSTQTYQIIADDGEDCIDTVFVTVTVVPYPELIISPNAPAICVGESVEITASGATSYLWSPDISLSGTTGATVTASPTNDQTYTVIGTTSGCSSETTVSVTVNEIPVITANPISLNVCPGVSTELSATGGLTYIWSPDIDLNTTVGSNVFASPSESITYTVTGTDSEGCSSTADVELIVSEISLNVEPEAPVICQGESVTIIVGGGLTYNWSPSEGLNTTSGSTVVANPVSTQTYQIVGSNADACLDTVLVTVTVIPEPEISFSPASPTICFGESVQIEASGATSFVWSPADGLSSTNGSIVTASPLFTQTYTVTGTTAGCSAESTVTVTVNDLPTISTTPANPIVCPGESIEISASGAVTFEWSPSTGLNTTTNAVVVASPNLSTVYTITGTDAQGCINSTQVEVIVSNLPDIDAGEDVTICAGNTIQLIGLSSVGISYSWLPGTGLSNPNDQFPIASPSQTTTYTVTVTDVNGCINSDDITVNVLSVIADFSADPETGSAPAEITFTNNSSSNAQFFTWDYGDESVEITNSFITQHLYTENGTYTVTLTATDINGCSDSYSLDIILLEPFSLFIPNIFTPNGDGTNDIFQPSVFGVTAFEVDIFDRWGTMVYNYSGANGKWDGTKNGIRCSDGVYFYVINLTTTARENQSHKGTITLLR